MAEVVCGITPSLLWVEESLIGHHNASLTQRVHFRPGFIGSIARSITAPLAVQKLLAASQLLAALSISSLIVRRHHHTIATISPSTIAISVVAMSRVRREKFNLKLQAHGAALSNPTKDFFTDALLERVTGLYGMRPDVDFVQIATLVENARP